MKHIIAVVGADTALGRNVLSVLGMNGVSVDDVVALSTSGSVGKTLSHGDDSKVSCENVDGYDFRKASVAIFTSADGIAERYVRDAVSGGCVVIDSTVHSRKDGEIPLIVSGINNECISKYESRGVIATPGSIASQVSAVLYPLHKIAEVERVVVSTYHSVSDSGREAMTELYDQTKSMFMNRKVRKSECVKQIAFNCVPYVGEFTDDDYTTEEQCISEEVRKILGGNVNVVATCVSVPVFVSHSVVLNVEFHRHISKEEAILAMEEAKDLLVVRRDSEMQYVTPVECVNDEEVYVSRIRSDNTVPHGINMWCVSDNLRRSASNLVQITQILVEEHLS